MLKRIRERMNESEGFTLIELMVVVLIIAILIAIAIPTFLGARERAQDRAAQSSLRNALTAAKTVFTDNEDYTQADATTLQAAEPSLTFTDPSDDPTVVTVQSPSSNLWQAAAYSNSDTCFYIQDNTQGPGTEFASEAEDSSASGDTNSCAASDIPGETDGSWGSEW